MKLPAAYDKVQDGPSVTLLFSHLSFCLTFTAIIFLLIKDITIGTITAMIFWVIATVFYLIRRLKTFKADLDDRSIEFDGGEDIEEKK